MVDETSSLPMRFRRLAWSNLAAQSADQVALAAAPLVAVFALGATEGENGLLQVALTLPFLLAAIPAGILADRVSRRRLMAGAEVVRAGALLGTLTLVQMDLITWPLLAALGLLSACGTVMYNVAAPALIPALVPANLLPRANARIELARTVAFASGPALGGTLVSSTGAGTAFGTAAGLSILAVMMLIGLQEPPRAVGVRRRVLQEAAEGARFVARHHLLRPVLITQFIFNTAFFAILAVLVPYAARHLQLEASGVGWTLACYGAGMMIGALLAPSAMRRTAFGTVIGIGPVAGFAASLLLMATIWAPYPAIAGASLFLLGVGPILWTISTTTLRQAVTPPNLLGRVSAMSTLAHGARPIGAGLGALIGSLLGAEACLVAATIGFAAQAVVILRSPAVGLLKQPDSLADEGWSPKGA